MKDDLRVCYIDIENSRMEVTHQVYDLKFNGYISPKSITKDWYITCAAWSWLDIKTGKMSKIESVSVLDFPKRFKKDNRDDLDVVKKLIEVIKSADVVIGHNVDKHDLGKIIYRQAKHGLPPLVPPVTVDTLKMARQIFNSSSNSLYHLAKELGVPCKIELPHGTMHRADDGDVKALKELVRYCKGDIKSGASIYFRMLPYMHKHPNLSKIFNNESYDSCPSCSSSEKIKYGVKGVKTATGGGTYQFYRCKSCGKVYKGEKV